MREARRAAVRYRSTAPFVKASTSKYISRLMTTDERRICAAHYSKLPTPRDSPLTAHDYSAFCSKG
jgi:hypothetical protein